MSSASKGKGSVKTVEWAKHLRKRKRALKNARMEMDEKMGAITRTTGG